VYVIGAVGNRLRPSSITTGEPTPRTRSYASVTKSTGYSGRWFIDTFTFTPDGDLTLISSRHNTNIQRGTNAIYPTVCQRFPSFTHFSM